MEVDYVIIGAGPSGLTLAYLLGKSGKKCLVLDQNECIGGCHRVKRVNGLFTEHSPRVYVSSYVNTIRLLKQMNIAFTDIYTPYHYTPMYFSSQVFKNLSFSETIVFLVEFFKLVFQFQYDDTITVQEFAQQHGFSSSSLNYLDRLCRFSDGAGMDRYSMYQLLQVINQQGLYQFFQPKRPNDVALFPLMQQSILATGNVTFQLQQTVQSIAYDQGQVTGVNTATQFIPAKNVILAVPPPAMSKILTASVSPVSTAFGNLSNWISQASYNNDIAATFHWDTSLNLAIVWGFPSSEWGLISIPLTEYMDMNDPRSRTVISTCITYLDTSSSYLNLTANQVTQSGDLLTEMFRQLKETYPTLPTPTHALLSPTAYRYQGQWVEQDSGFFKSAQINYLSSKSTIPNLYQVGPQNGTSGVSFTTFEAAVTNAMTFYNSHTAVNTQPIQHPIEIRMIIQWIIMFLLVVLLGILIWIYFRDSVKEGV